MKRFVFLMVFLIYAPDVWAQGNDFNLPPPIFIIPQQFSVPGLTGLMLPQVINNEKKSAAEVAANDYDRAAAGADNAAGYWCSPSADFFSFPSFLVCGYMAHVAASSRVYAQANRLIQRDPIDPRYGDPAYPVYLEASQLGLWYMPESDPTAPYSNWLVSNTISFYAWADMVRITADRAATCLLLESGNNRIHCSEWQLERLWWGMQNMIDLEHEMGNRILPGIRNDLWSLGFNWEGDLVNSISWDAIELARILAAW
jgi:hypothetical protein